MATDLVATNCLGSDKGHGRRGRRRWGWGHGGGRCRAGQASGLHQAAHQPEAAREEVRLSEALVGDTVIVTGILGDEAFRGRLMAMGILPGVTLGVVRGGRRQPLLVALPGSRCVVDACSSEMITVRRARPGCGRERARQ